MKKAIAIILSIMLVLVITLPAAAISTIAVKSITLNNSNITLKIGETSNLEVTLTPANTSQMKLTYVTGNKNVASVSSDGKIRGVHGGITTITVLTLNNKIFAKCKVTVAAPKGNITFMVLDSFTSGGKNQPLYVAVDRFMKLYQGINVTIEPVPATNIKDKFTITSLSGAGPDVISLDSAGWAIDAASANILAPLDDRLNAIKDQFFDGPLNSGIYKGKYYAVPWYMNNLGLFYNKKILSDAGISAPPATWADLTADIQKVNKIGKKGIILPFFYPSYVMYAFYGQTGNPVIDTTGDKPKSTLMTDSGKEAFNFLADLANKYNAFPESMKDAMSWDQTYAPFANGEVAFMFCGDWGNWGVSNANKGLNYGIAPLPAGKKAATVLGGYTLSINKNTKNFDTSWAFIQWLTAKEQNQMLLQYGRIGARKDIDRSSLEIKYPYLKTFIEQSATTQARPAIKGLAQFDDLFSNAFREVYFKSKTADKALADMNEKVNELLDKEYK